jgi:hypothetical protein
MLENLTFTGRELLLAVILASLVYFIEVLIFSRRRKPQRDSELRNLLNAMESELNELKARVESLEAQPPANSSLDTQSITLAEAMRLAREGIPPQEVAARLGISRSEAELITALQKAES